MSNEPVYSVKPPWGTGETIVYYVLTIACPVLGLVIWIFNMGSASCPKRREQAWGLLGTAIVMTFVWVGLIKSSNKAYERGYNQVMEQQWQQNAPQQ